MGEHRPRLLLITSEWTAPVPRAPARPNPPGALKRQAEALQAAGLWVEIFAFRGRTAYNYAAAWTQLRPRLRPERYDLVHAQDTSNVLLTLPKRVPLVVTVHRWDSPRLQEQLLARFLARRADAMIVASDEMRARVGTSAPVHVIPPDLDEPALAAWLVDVYRSVASDCFSAS